MYNSNNVQHKGEENKMPLRAKEDETFSEQLKTPDKSSTSVTGEGKSILKRRKRYPLQDLYTPSEASISRPSNRRVSFAVSEVKEFRQPANEGTLWGNSYVFDIQKSSSESERTGSSTSEFLTSSVSGAGGCVYSQQTIVEETISVSFFPESDSEDDHTYADGENDFEEQIFMHCKEDPKIINKFVGPKSHTNESLLKKCSKVVNTLGNKINSKGNYESDKQEFICFDSAEMLNSFEGPQIVRNPSVLLERNGTKGQNNQMPSKNSHKHIVNSDKENGDITSLPDINSPSKLLHKHQLPVCEDLKVVKRRRHEKSEGDCLLKWLAEGPETMKGQNLFEHTKRQSRLSTENTEIMENDILVSENLTPPNKSIHLNLSKNEDFTGINEPFSKLSNDHLTKNKLENGVINDSRGDMPCQSKENTSANHQFNVFKERMDEKFIGASATTCKGNLSPTMVGGRVLNHVSPDSLPQHFTGTNGKDSSISTEENIFHDMDEISENLSKSVNGCERSPSPTMCGGRILKPVYMTNNMLVNPPDMCNRSNSYTSVESNMIHSTKTLSQVSAATGYGSVTPTIAGGRILKETNFSPNILLKHLNDINGKVSSLSAKERTVHDTEEFSENLSKSLNGCEWSPSRIMSGDRISKSVPSSHNMIINPFHRSSKCNSEVSVEGNMNLSEALSYKRPFSPTICDGSVSPTIAGGRILRTNNILPNSLNKSADESNRKAPAIALEGKIMNTVDPSSNNLSGFSNVSETTPSPTMPGGILKPILMTQNMLVNTLRSNRSNSDISGNGNIFNSTEVLSHKLPVSSAGYGSVSPTIIGGRILKETYVSPNSLFTHRNATNGNLSPVCPEEKIGHVMEEISEHLSKSSSFCERSPSPTMPRGRILKPIYMSPNSLVNVSHRSNPDMSGECKMFNSTEELAYKLPVWATACDGSGSPTFIGGRILMATNVSTNSLNKPADEGNRKSSAIAVEGKQINTMEASSNNLLVSADVNKTSLSPTMSGGMILKPVEMSPSRLVHHSPRNNRSERDMSVEGNMYNSTDTLSHTQPVTATTCDGSVSPTLVGGRILMATNVSSNSLNKPADEDNGKCSAIAVEGKQINTMEASSNNLLVSADVSKTSLSPTMSGGMILKPVEMLPSRLVHHSPRNNRSERDMSVEGNMYNSTDTLSHTQPVTATTCDGSVSPTLVGGRILMATNVSPNSLNKPADEDNGKCSAIAVEGKQINTMEASSNNLLVSADVSKTSLSPTMSGGMILKPVEMLPSRLVHHSPRNNRSERDMSVEGNMYNSTDTLSHTQPVTATTCDGSVSPTLVGGRILMATNVSPNSLNKPADEDNGKCSAIAVEGKQINTMEASSNNLLVSADVSKTSLSPTMSVGMILKPVEMSPSRLVHHSPRNNRSERDMSVEGNMYNSTDTLSHTQPVTATTCDGSVSPTLVGGRILMATNVSPNSLNKCTNEGNVKSSAIAVEGKQINTMEASSNNLLVSADVSKTSLSPTMSEGMILKPVEMSPSRLVHHSPRNNRSEHDMSVEGNMYNSTDTLSHTQPVTATTCDGSVSPTLVGGRILMATNVSPNSLNKCTNEGNVKSSAIAVEGKQINTMEASSNNLLVSADVSKTSLSPTMSGGMILKPVEMSPSRLVHHSPRNNRSERDMSVEGNMYNSTDTLSHTQPVTATTCDGSVSPTLVGGRILMATNVSPNSLNKCTNEGNGKSSAIAVEGKQINTMEASSNKLLVSADVSKTSLSPTMSGGMILKPVEMLPSRLVHHSPRNNRSERDMSVEGNMYNSTETLSHTQLVTATTCDGSVSPTLVGGRILMATNVSPNRLNKPVDEGNGKSSAIAVEGKQINTMEASSNNLLVSADVSKTSLSPTMSGGMILKPVEMLPSRLVHHSPRNNRSERDMSVEGNMYNSTETLSHTQPVTATTCDGSVSPTFVGGRILMANNVSPNSLNKRTNEGNVKSSAIAVAGKQINTMEASSNNLLVSADVNKASLSPTMPGGTILKPVDRSCSRLEHDSPCLSNCQNVSTCSVAQFITSKNISSEDHVKNVTVQNDVDVDDVLHVPLLSKDQEDLINKDENYQNVIEHLESNNSVSSNVSNVDMIKDESIEPVVEAVEILIKSVQREEIQNDSTIKSFTTYYKDSVKCEVKMFCSELLRKLAFEGRQVYSFAKGEVSQMSKKPFESKHEETPHNTEPSLGDNTECTEVQCSRQTFFYDGGSESIQNSSPPEIAKKKGFLTFQYQERSGVQYNKLEDVSDPVTGDKSPEMRLKHKRCASEERNTSIQECPVPEKKTKLYPCNINSTEEFSALTTVCSVERWLKQQSGSCSWRIEILTLTKIKLYFFQDTLQFLVEFNSNNFSVKEIDFVSHLQGSYQKLFLNDLFMKRLQFNTLKERFPFKKDIPELIAFISAQEEFLKQFNEDWLSLEILQAIKMNNDFWAEFQVESFYLRQLFIVKINLNKWNGGRLHSKYVKVHQLIGDIDETEIQRLMRAIPEGPHLLRMYIDHLFTYIQKKEKLQCESFSLRKKDIK